MRNSWLKDDQEFEIYAKDDIVITAFKHDEQLWVFTKTIWSWSPSTFKRWKVALESIKSFCLVNRLDSIWCYASNNEVKKFCVLLGFQPYDIRNSLCVLRLSVQD